MMTALLTADRAESLVVPLDESNRALLQHVRPPDWVNHTPRGLYDLVVVGGGTAGLVSAIGAAGLGARVALVERHLLGGDCLNVGCVPSKALLRSARSVGEARRSGRLGVRIDRIAPDFGTIMSRMRERRADLSPNDSASRLQRVGVEPFFGQARFTSRRTLDVDGLTLRFNRAVIATGTRATLPPVLGLAELRYLTNETLFWLTDLPRRLIVLGGGPIGCEMAQAFARFGSTVTLLDRSPHVLPREDADAAAVVEDALRQDGVRLELGVRVMEAGRDSSGVRVRYARPNNADSGEAIGDEVLVAAGRTPNIEDLGLEAAGVDATSQGIVVNDRLRTSNRRVYAAGDVCSTFKFTHAADAMARLVIQNALFYGRRRASALVIPWCTYTDPEVAHVGLRDKDARQRGHDVATVTIQLGDVDRTVIDDEIDGFVRIHHERGRLLGCTIVASHAGDLIGQVAYAMAHDGALGDLSSTIYPYPTQAEALRKAGDAYRRALVTPRLRRFLEAYFRWTR